MKMAETNLIDDKHFKKIADDTIEYAKHLINKEELSL